VRLLRDLWATSPRRTGAVALLIILGAAGQAAASALAGAVLLGRSAVVFVVLAGALAVSVLSDVVVGLLMARLTADWTAAVRRGLCRVAFGQDLPTLETTPVGELLDRIDNDVYSVGAELRGSAGIGSLPPSESVTVAPTPAAWHCATAAGCGSWAAAGSTT